MVARDDRGNAVAEAHLEGPSPYTLTGDLMAWAAHQLASGRAKTAGATGPVQAFGLEELMRGCSDVGLTKIAPADPMGPPG